MYCGWQMKLTYNVAMPNSILGDMWWVWILRKKENFQIAKIVSHAEELKKIFTLILAIRQINDLPRFMLFN